MNKWNAVKIRISQTPDNRNIDLPRDYLKEMLNEYEELKKEMENMCKCEKPNIAFVNEYRNVGWCRECWKEISFLRMKHRGLNVETIKERIEEKDRLDIKIKELNGERDFLRRLVKKICDRTTSSSMRDLIERQCDWLEEKECRHCEMGQEAYGSEYRCEEHNIPKGDLNGD